MMYISAQEKPDYCLVKVASCANQVKDPGAIHPSGYMTVRDARPRGLASSTYLMTVS